MNSEPASSSDDAPTRSVPPSAVSAGEPSTYTFSGPVTPKGSRKQDERVVVTIDSNPQDSAAAEPANPQGRKLGEFCLLREIGRGGMGTVFEAIQEGLGRKVAVKVLRGAAMMDDRAIRRFHREAAAIARLHHPNVIPVYSVGEQDGTHYYAMELVTGVSLGRVIRSLRSGAVGDTDPFDPQSYPPSSNDPQAGVLGLSSRSKHAASARTRSEDSPGRRTLATNRRYINSAIEMIAQVADALQHAHDQGIIHRDIKPGNLLLAAPGKLVLMDFGLAHQEDVRTLTLTGDFMGTPMYMSPEQAMAGRVAIDHRTDIYSLGVTLYELLTLHAPFEGAETHSVLHEVLVKEPLSFRRLSLRLPRDLEVITFKALEKDPDRRYQTAREFAEDLRRFLHFEAIQARPPGPLTRVMRHLRRNRTGFLISGTTIVLACVLAFLIVGHTRWQQARRVREVTQQGFDLLTAAQAAPGDLEAEQSFEDATQHFTAALAMDNKDETAARGLVEAYLQRCRRALDRGQYEVARGILLPLRKLDPGGRYADEIAAYERQALGTGTWELATQPPGSRVTLTRFDEQFRPGEAVEMGNTPLARQNIVPGSYLVVLAQAGYPEVRYPMLIERNESKSLQIKLVPKEQIPPGMVYVPAGEFWYGDRQTGSAKKINLPSFFIDRTEVTGEEYEKFLKATKLPPPEDWGGLECPPPLRASAVYNVSWFEAMEYARWAGKRLPTEQEWEKAARGVDGRIYPWGNGFEPWRCNCRESPERDWLSVGRHRGGASPYGCLDMAGNVWEWTLDREKPNRALRVMRGGAAYSSPDELPVYRRQGAPPGGSGFGGLNLVGFRCVKPLEPEPARGPVLEELSSPGDLDKAAEFYWGRQSEHRQLDQVRQCAERLLERNSRSVVGNFWKSLCLLSENKSLEALGGLKVVYFQRPAFRNTPEQLYQLRDRMARGGTSPDFAFMEMPRMLIQAERLLDEGKQADAEALLLKVLAFDRENAVAHEKMAEVCRALGRPAEAHQHQLRRIHAYRTALTEDPDNGELHNEFADFLVANELYAREGLASAERAVQLEPESPAYHATLAEFYYHAKRAPEALAEIERAIRLDPEETKYREQQKDYQRNLKRKTQRK